MTSTLRAPQRRPKSDAPPRVCPLAVACLVLLSSACGSAAADAPASPTSSPATIEIVRTEPAPAVGETVRQPLDRGPHVPTPTERANGALPHECDEYLELFKTCVANSVTPAAREASLEAAEQIRAAWTQMAKDEGSSEALRVACITAAESLQQAAPCAP